MHPDIARAMRLASAGGLRVGASAALAPYGGCASGCCPAPAPEQIYQQQQAADIINQVNAGQRPSPYGPRCRELFLSFDSGTNVAAGASASPSLNPQITFQGTRLVVPSIIAPFFLITSLNVGNQLQQAATGNTNLQVFSEVGVGVGLDLDTAYPGVTVSMAVSNIDADPHRFFATLIGRSVQN